MEFEPGPIPALAPNVPQLAGEPSQFADLTTAALSDLDGVESDMDTVITALDPFGVPEEFDVIDLDTSTMDEALNELTALPTANFLDTADQAIADATDQFQQVASASPAEIWSAVPPPQFNPSAGGPQPGTNGPTQLTITNATRPTDTKFYSGDQFHVHILVEGVGGQYDFANKAIKLTRNFNGVDLPELDVGGTNDVGALDYTGTFQAADVGAWLFGVDPPGVGTNPLVNLTVLPGPAPGSPGGPAGPPVVLFENLSTGDPSTFHVGDTWRMTITGAAGQPVYLDQVKDGVDNGEVFIGSTDATGTLVVAGTISAGQLGSYIETFRVGTTPAGNELVFQVIA